MNNILIKLCDIHHTFFFWSNTSQILIAPYTTLDMYLLENITLILNKLRKYLIVLKTYDSCLFFYQH
jgi:hypothetical protein